MYRLNCCVAVAVAGLSGQAVADTIYVPADQPTIQAAIDAAVSGGEVVVAPGTYNESINFSGKAITLRSSGGRDVTTIDGSGLDTSVVTCVSGEGPATVLSGFTITGGVGTLVGEQRYGGGMYNLSSSPTVTDCTFVDNEAANVGGGMCNRSSSHPTISGCIFDGNTSGLGGGMINWANSVPTVSDCLFNMNSADGGGGMFNTGSSPIVTSCTFRQNVAGGGGGMTNAGSGSPSVSNCTFVDNIASLGNGGGMSLGFAVTVTNCFFGGNDAMLFGGAMYFSGGPTPLTVINCTITGNAKPIYIREGPVTIRNCIIRGNINGQIVIEDGPVTVAYSNIEGGWPGVGNINADPQFVDPANGDYRLQSGSASIDAADNTAVPVEITTDLDGNPRFFDDPDTPDTGNGDPPIVDMGAYEFQGPPVPCVADIDLDGFVGVPDLLLLLAQWGPCPPICLGDLNGDGVVNVPDLLELLANWGPCP